jgi:hypothetical protein
MSNPDFEGFFEGDWDDPWEIAWNEFDWENYLRQQDRAVQTYLEHYERTAEGSERIDQVAHLMGWDQHDWTTEDGADLDVAEEEDAAEESPDVELDPYTVQKHPIFIATKALYCWLQAAWSQAATAEGRIPAPALLKFQASLFRGEANASHAIQSLDMGDYALAICQFKRALAEVNASLAELNGLDEVQPGFLAQLRRQATARLFDLREIWLRVMRDCREELDRRVSDGEE